MRTTLLHLTFVLAASARPTAWADSSSFSDGLGSYAQSIGQDCDLSGVQMPAAPTPLPSPSGSLSHVLIGRGTQNYTCDLTNSTAIPVLIGAIATLYDASCAIKSSSQFANLLTSLAYSVRTHALPSLSTDPAFNSKFIAPNNKAKQTLFELEMTPYVLGHHYFVNSTTPRFDLNTANGQDGAVTVAKLNVSNAPVGAQASSVAWLYLGAVKGLQDQGFSEVYRVETMGGSPPATCKDAGEAAFAVRYAAQYWFYK